MDVQFGNAALSSANHRGWFLGQFIGVEGDLLHSIDLEVKWGVHPKGDSRQSWSSNQATSLSILIAGAFKLKFEDQEHVLSTQGDYVVWAPGVLHTWEALEASIVLTIRWPSNP
jgi:hypothetical protein